MPGFSAVPRSITTAVLMLGALTSCGGSDSGDPTDPNSEAGVSFSLSSTSLTLVQGQSGTVNVTVSRTSGVKGALSLAIAGVGPDITGTFNPASLPEGTSTTTLTIATATTVPTGTTTVFIEPTLNGAHVNINGAPPKLSLTVNLRPGITVTKSGTGSGTVTSNPAGINCGGTCFAQFNPEPLTLTAAPAAGSVFVSWAGGCVGTSLTCTFTPGNFGSSINATFNSTAQAMTVSVSPSPVTVQAGSSTTATLTVNRINGFANPVTLAVNAPNGLTVSPSPASVTQTTSTLTISAGPSFGAGNYPVTVTATGAGVTQQSVTLSVQVTPPPSGGTITFNYAGCETTQIPMWFAVQNGTGPWTRVTPTSNAFNFSIGATGAIAIVTRDGISTETNVTYANAAEIAGIAIAGPCRGPATGTKRVSGTFANAGQISFLTAKVMIGGAEFTKTNDFIQGFTLTNVPSGARDLVAIGRHLTNPPLSRIILRRGTNYNNNANIPTLDFGNVAESVTPKFGGVTLTNLGTDSSALEASLVTTLGESPTYYSISGAPPSGRVPYFGLPDTLLREGDFHSIAIFAAPSSSSTTFRFLQLLQRSASERTTTFGPQLGTATQITTVGTTPYLRLHAQIPTQGSYTSGASAEYSQSDNSVSILMTAAYLSSPPTTWALDIPDLSGAGYDPAWALKNGTGVSWSVIAVSGNILPFIGGSAVDNAQITGAAAQGSSATFTAARRAWFARRPRP